MKYVPTAEFAPVLRRLIASEDTDVILLSEKAGLHKDTLDSILRQRRESCDFDAADRLLCVMGAQHLWWTELAHIYYAIDLALYDRVIEYREHRCQRGHVTNARIRRDGNTQCGVCNAADRRRYRQRQAERLAA